MHHGSPARLLPWLQTLTALVTKVGLLLESTVFYETKMPEVPIPKSFVKSTDTIR